jgi:hypothetical protein
MDVWTTALRAHSAGHPTVTPSTSPNPQSEIRSPQSPPPTTILRSLLAALHDSHRAPHAARRALLDCITPDFRFDHLQLAPDTQNRIIGAATTQVAQATYDDKALESQQPAPGEHSHSITLRVRRGDHTTPFAFSFTREPDRWRLAAIRNGRAPPR